MGGNDSRKTLPLVARFADIWNGQWLSPQAFRECSDHLDTLLMEAKHPPQEVKRTLYSWLHFGSTPEDLQQALNWRRMVPELACLFSMGLSVYSELHPG